jgi:hypothetical protein
MPDMIRRTLKFSANTRRLVRLPATLEKVVFSSVTLAMTSAVAAQALVETIRVALSMREKLQVPG